MIVYTKANLNLPLVISVDRFSAANVWQLFFVCMSLFCHFVWSLFVPYSFFFQCLGRAI